MTTVTEFLKRNAYLIRLSDGRNIYRDDDGRWWLSNWPFYFDDLSELVHEIIAAIATVPNVTVSDDDGLRLLATMKADRRRSVTIDTTPDAAAAMKAAQSPVTFNRCSLEPVFIRSERFRPVPFNPNECAGREAFVSDRRCENEPTVTFECQSPADLHELGILPKTMTLKFCESCADVLIRNKTFGNISIAYKVKLEPPVVESGQATRDAMMILFGSGYHIADDMPRPLVAHYINGVRAGFPKSSEYLATEREQTYCK